MIQMTSTGRFDWRQADPAGFVTENPCNGFCDLSGNRPKLLQTAARWRLYSMLEALPEQRC